MTNTEVRRSVTVEEPHFWWPILTEETSRAVEKQLSESISLYNRSGVIERVEVALEQWHGVAHATLTNSGTSALHAAYVAINAKPGDEIIVPAYTFFATATPLLQTGATPVLVDADERGNLDSSRVREAITDRTTAIVVTHMWGLPADMEVLREIADEHEITVIEDTSHAFGAAIGNRPVGAFGHLAAQSLQGQKPLTGGEGGVLLTNDDDLFYRALAIAHYNVRCKQEIPKDHPLSEVAVTGLGLKWRIHPVAAAIVEQQLSIYSEMHRGRERMADRMKKRLNRLHGLNVIEPRDGETSSWYAMVLRLDNSVLALASVDEIIEALHEEGAVEADRPGSTRPISHLPLFQDPGRVLPAYEGTGVGFRADDYPGANDFYARTFKLPVWHRDEDLTVVDQYLDAFEKVWHDLGLDN